MSNPYCDALKIPVPSLQDVKGNREANTFALLLVALLERGGPMKLTEVARRFEAAGIASAEEALRSLQRCRPARPPVYRDGDAYALDPHDDELDLWAFRLGLRPAKVPALRVVKPEPPPLPSPDAPLSTEELDEAIRDAWIGNWSAQRLAIAVLDAHGGELSGAEAVSTLKRLTSHHTLREKAAKHWRRGAPVQAREDGTWVLDTTHPHVFAARKAVRGRLEVGRRYAHRRFDPTVHDAQQRYLEKKRQEHAEELARLRRVILHGFPLLRPEAVVLLDVAHRTLDTYVGDELDAACVRLADYDLIAALDVRSALRGLEFDPEQRRVVDLGPPQKTRRLNKRGRTLKLTAAMLVQGSCGIARPFGEPTRLQRYLDEGQLTKLRRRLEADAKALFALYQYGRLHGFVRLRWGFLDESVPAPWRHPDEPSLHGIVAEAYDEGRAVEVIVGSAPGWADPWARAKRCRVVQEEKYKDVLVDEEGSVVDDWEVQAVRIVR